MTSPVDGRRARARDLGVAPGIFDTGRLNAITDVPGVRVGHVTIRKGEKIRTGVTAILAHGGNHFFSRVPAGLHVTNGFGKLVGSTQVEELGELESPVLLTSTLSVWRVADALVTWMLAQKGMKAVRSINPIVAETNDGLLNDIRARPITEHAVVQACTTATGGPVAEGSVGAGTGTIAFGWKGGVGTSSRVLPAWLGSYKVGVLVQTNFGGLLQVLGAPIGKALGRHPFAADGKDTSPPGSIVMVAATNAPLSDRNLRRLAKRTSMGLARTGSSSANGSGDYAIAFSTAREVRRRPGKRPGPVVELANEQVSGLFQAVSEATEEAIYNSLFQATTVSGNGRTVQAIPLDKVRELLRM